MIPVLQSLRRRRLYACRGLSMCCVCACVVACAPNALSRNALCAYTHRRRVYFAYVSLTLPVRLSSCAFVPLIIVVSIIVYCVQYRWYVDDDDAMMRWHISSDLNIADADRVCLYCLCLFCALCWEEKHNLHFIRILFPKCSLVYSEYVYVNVRVAVRASVVGNGISHMRHMWYTRIHPQMRIYNWRRYGPEL